MNSIVEILLSSVIVGLPQIAIATVGLILFHNRLKRFHPRASLCGIFGSALLLAHGLLGVLTQIFIQTSSTQVQERVALANKLVVINVASYVIMAASLVLLLLANFADRTSEKSSRGAA